mgnify:CR=1 FL=1
MDDEFEELLQPHAEYKPLVNIFIYLYDILINKMFRCELCDCYLSLLQGGYLCPTCYEIRTITKCYNAETILACLKSNFKVESEYENKNEEEVDKEEKVYGDDNKDYDTPPKNDKEKYADKVKKTLNKK